MNMMNIASRFRKKEEDAAPSPEEAVHPGAGEQDAAPDKGKRLSFLAGILGGGSMRRGLGRTQEGEPENPSESAAAGRRKHLSGRGRGKSAGPASGIQPGAEVAAETENVVRVGRRRIAVNLFWQLRDDTLGLKEQASRLSEQTGQDYETYALDKEGRQVAFTPAERGVEAGMPVGVTMFTPSLGANWIGSFKVSPTRFWLVMVRDGSVLGDRIGDQDEIFREYMHNIDGALWDRMLAPADWNIRGTEPGDPGSLLTETGTAVRNVSMLRAYWKRGMIAGILAVGLIGLWQGYAWWAEQERIAEIQRQRALQEYQRMANMAPPWTRLPSPDELFSACRIAIAGMLFDAPGWAQGEVRCTASDQESATVETSWTRQLGRIHMLRMMRPDALADVPIDLDRSGIVATMKRTISIGAEERDGEKPWQIDQIERRILERYQVMGLTIRLTSRPARPTSAQRRQGVPLFGYHELAFSTGVGVEEHISLVRDVPAIAGHSVSYDKNTSEFSFQIRIYHPPILPSAR